MKTTLTYFVLILLIIGSIVAIYYLYPHSSYVTTPAPLSKKSEPLTPKEQKRISTLNILAASAPKVPVSEKDRSSALKILADQAKKSPPLTAKQRQAALDAIGN